MKKVPLHFVQLDCDLRKRACEREREGGTIFLRVSRDETTTQTGDATDLPPTRTAANSGVLHLSIRPVVRLANRGTA